MSKAIMYKPNEMVALYAGSKKIIQIKNLDDAGLHEIPKTRRINIFRCSLIGIVDQSIYAYKDGNACKMSSLTEFIKESQDFDLEWETETMEGFRIVERAKQAYILLPANSPIFMQQKAI